MEIMELLAGRRSYRRFLQTPVPENLVEDILQAARLASSAANRQPLKYAVLQTAGAVAAVNAGLVHWAAYLPPEQGAPAPGECPTLYLAVLQDTAISQSCDTDAGLAIGNMTLAAWAAGVGSCVLGAIDRPALCALMGIGAEYKLHSLVAFGYPAHKSAVVPAQQGDIRYYLDDNRDYCVPKRALGELVVRRI